MHEQKHVTTTLPTILLYILQAYTYYNANINIGSPQYVCGPCKIYRRHRTSPTTHHQARVAQFKKSDENTET